MLRYGTLMICLVAALTAAASADVLVFDDFGPSTEPNQNLNGRTPLVGPNDWVGYSSTTNANDGWKVYSGQALLGTSTNSNAMAGVSLGASYFSSHPGLYSLRAHLTLQATTATSWYGFGFAQAFSTSSSHGLYDSGTTEGRPWMFLRNNGELNVRAAGGTSYTIYSQSGYDVTDINLELQLDTSTPQWTFAAFANGTQLDLNGAAPGMLYTYTINPTTIAAVGLSASSGSPGSVQSITLELIPEPASLALFSLAGLTLLRRRQGRRA